MGTPDGLKRVLTRLLASTQYSPKSIISTIFGDMIAPRGATVWLGSVVKATALFKIEEAHARTAALRLAYEGWVDAQRVGKLSYYSIAPATLERLGDYMPRVYGSPRRSWDGTFHIIFTHAVKNDRRGYIDLKQALQWQGVGQLAPHVFISLASGADALQHVLTELGYSELVQIVKASSINGEDSQKLTAVVAQAWDLSELEHDYQRFIRQFAPVLKTVQESPDTITEEAGFVLRTLLILEYRRIVIRDPQLPAPLHKPTWVGFDAFELCRTLYQLVLPASERFLANNFTVPSGAMPSADRSLYKRFGGID